jgi:hypothetical protein
MAGKAASNRSAERADQDARISDLEDAQQAPAAPAVPEQRASQSAGSDVLSQLTELVNMHDRGALTDEEFSAAKARLLG